MNNIPKGYRQTDVGVIPNDWELTQLGEIGSFKKGKGIKKDAVISDGFPCVRYGELYTTHHEYIKEFKSFISIETAKESQRINKGDLLFAGSGETKEEIGKCAAFIGGEEAYAGGDVIIFSPKEIDSLYLGFLLNQQLVVKQKAQRAQGDAVVHIYPNNLSDISISLPPTKAEQTAISAALSDADVLIQSIEKLIAKKRNIKQGAMQELLKPKEGWVVKKLGNFLDYEQPTKYLVADTKYNDNNDTPVLTAGKTFILGYTNEDFGIYKNNLPVIIFDDFTTATKYVDFPFKAKSSAMKILRKKYETVNLRFIFEIMQRINSPLGDHKRHWIAEYQNIGISVPMVDEQTRIATILSDMDAEIAALETRLAKYRQIKQGMMQELLTGKIRLI